MTELWGIIQRSVDRCHLATIDCSARFLAELKNRVHEESGGDVDVYCALLPYPTRAGKVTLTGRDDSGTIQAYEAFISPLGEVSAVIEL
jgi:hypothetical protein